MLEQPILSSGEFIRDIPGYEGLYAVTNTGKVWSYGNNNSNYGARWIKAKPINVGYLYVGLYKDGRCKNFRVHRLVATAFIPNPGNKPFVNHKDFNVQNNCVENLEWCTPAENSAYSKERGRWDNMVKKETWRKGVEAAKKKETWKIAVAKSIEQKNWLKRNQKAWEMQTYKIAQRAAKEANKKAVNLFKAGLFVAKFPSVGEAAQYAFDKGWASFSTLKTFKKSRDCTLEFAN